MIFENNSTNSNPQLQKSKEIIIVFSTYSAAHLVVQQGMSEYEDSESSVDININPKELKHIKKIDAREKRAEREHNKTIHQTHLLCLLAHHRILANFAFNEELQAVFLSQIPVAVFQGSSARKIASKLNRWIKTCLLQHPTQTTITMQSLMDGATSLRIPQGESATLSYVSACTALGLQARYVTALFPAPLVEKKIQKRRANRLGC